MKKTVVMISCTFLLLLSSCSVYIGLKRDIFYSKKSTVKITYYSKHTHEKMHRTYTFTGENILIVTEESCYKWWPWAQKCCSAY